MSGSHRGSRAPIGRIQLILRLSLVLAIALLSIPFLGAVAKADEGTPPVEPSATTTSDPAAEPTEEPATEPAQEPAEEPAEEPEASEPAAADPATEDPAPAAPTKQTRTASSSTLTQATETTTTGTCPPYTGGGKVLGFDQNTAEDSSGSWINGALNQNNSSYAEGDFVPQRLRLGSLNAGLHTFSFTYERTKSQGSDFAYAYDYVAGLDVTGATSFSWDAATPVQPMPFATLVTVNVTFTMPAGTSGAATVTWRGHVASELVYGPGKSASWISGAPYHFGLGSLDCASMGSQDNQLMASAIEYATLTVVKDAQPNDPTDFTFDVEAPNGLSRSLTLDDDSDATLSDRATYQVPPGTTTIREAAAGDWALTGISCTDTSATTDLGARTAAVVLADRESVTCTFTNSRTASVSVDKRWVVKASAADPGTAYNETTKPAHLGLQAQLKLSGPGSTGATNQAWGVSRDGYTQGANVSIDETSTIGNPLCSPVSSKVTAANGSTVTGGGLPYATALGGGANTYTLTNTVLCTGQVTLVKVVDNGPAVATAWTLSATRSSAGDLQGPSGSSGSSAATGPVTAGATYDLGETGGDSRYAQNGAWQCTDGVSVSNGRIQVAAGRSTTCTVHNATAKVTLVKSVTNDDGGSATADRWTLHAGGFSGTSGQSFWVEPGETLALSESGGPSGYGAGPASLTCSDAPGSQVTTVTPAAGAHVTCTFVNDDQPAALALTKVLAQGDSGSQTPATAFTLSATPQSIAGQATESGAGGFGSRPVKAGTYLLSETGPTGYTPGTWNCTGGTMGGSSGAQTVAIANGGSATCTITNTAITPTLTLVKDRQAGATGSSTPATAWTLTANGPTMIAGSTGSTGASGVTGRPVPVGTYTLSESGPTDGWTASDWVCTGGATIGGTPAARTVSIGLGQNVVCTITNTARPAHLSLDKDARANGTGTGLGDTAWTLAYAGPATAAGAGGVARTEVPIGGYTLTETGPTEGWTASAWTCTQALPGGGTTAHQVTTDPDGTGHVNIALGQDVSCTIVNTAMKPGLTLLKKVDGNGTGAETYTPDTSWTLHAELVGNESPAVAISGTEGDPDVTGADVPVGTYALSESGGPAPWTGVGWACTDATGAAVPVTDGRVTVALGQDVACEVTNRAVPSTWTVTKTNTPGSGSTVDEGDLITYTVTATKNAGGVDVLGAKVTDDLSDILPDKGSLVGSIVTSSGTAESVGTSIVWTIPRLGAVPQTLTYQIRVGSLDGVTLRNHATGDGAEECLKGDPDCTTTNPTPHYVLDKAVDFDDSDGDGFAEPGQDLVYTLRLRNDSRAVLTDAVVHDDISDVLAHGTLDESALAAEGLALDDSDPEHPFLVWEVTGPVLPGGTAEATYTVTVADDAWGESLVNVATPEDGVGSCAVAADCTTTTDTPPETILTLRKDVDPGTTGDDTAATAWHLSATPAPAVADQGVVEGDGSVTETVRIGTYLLAEDGPSTYEADEAGWVCTDDGGDPVAVEDGKVTTPRGAHVTCAITNHAVPSGWRVTKTSPTNLGTVHPGDTIEYQLTVERVGSGVDVRDIDVTDHLVDVLSGGKATFDTGSALSSTAGSVTEPTAGSTDLVWHVDRLHDTATLDYSVTVGDVFGAVLRNAATPGSEPCVDPDPSDAVECDSTTHYTPHYVLDKAVDFDDPDGDGKADPGQDLTYTLTVRNDTQHAIVDDVVVIDDLSDVLLDAAMTSTTDELAAQGLALEGAEGDEYLEWTVPGPVAPGASVSASYVVTVDGHAWGRSLRNVATPQDDEGECGQCTTTTETPVEPAIIPEEPATPPTSPPHDPLAPVLPVLPDTGAPEHLLRLVLLGTLAVAAGIALVGRRRRRGEAG